MIPFLWMLSTALKSPDQVFKFPPKWIPNPIKWSNFAEALTSQPFGLYAKNTMVIVAISVVGELVSSAFVGYSFARIRFPGREALFVLVLSTLMIPYPVLLIPHFILFNTLGWIDTILPLTIPSFFSKAFYVFLFRQFFRAIPRELDDAALIDGCGIFGIFGRITLPLSKPVVAVVAIYSFMFHWNRFIGPLVYLNSMKKYTLSMGLAMYHGVLVTEWHWLMAASLVVMLPCLLLFFFFQRLFIQGVVFTGLKG
jgi:ABC-type glycerol-3-phosphate transport system permease component